MRGAGGGSLGGTQPGLRVLLAVGDLPDRPLTAAGGRASLPALHSAEPEADSPAQRQAVGSLSFDENKTIPTELLSPEVALGSCAVSSARQHGPLEL